MALPRASSLIDLFYIKQLFLLICHKKALRNHMDQEVFIRVLIEEHLLSFLKQIACQFQLLSDSCSSVTQPAAFLERFLYPSLSKVMLISSITATLIFQR